MLRIRLSETKSREIVLVALVSTFFGLAGAACTGNDAGSVDVERGTFPIGGVEPEGDCAYFHSALISGSKQYAGYVKMWNDSDSLVLSVRSEGGWIDGSWLLKDVTIFVGDAFVDTRDHSDEPVATSSWVIPLVDLDASCFDELVVVVQATVVRGGEEVVVWGYGTPTDEGWSFVYALCCEESTGCTFTQGYWKNHVDLWPVSELTIGGVVYAAPELRALLRTAPRGDASIILAHQYIAARLNVASGASANGDIDTAFVDADSWLAANADGDGRLPYGVRASTVEGQAAVAYATLLTSYNEGSAGTPHCDDAIDEPLVD